MSVVVQRKLINNQLKSIINDLTFGDDMYNRVYAYSITPSKVYLPFHYAVNTNTINARNLPPTIAPVFSTSFLPTHNLRPDQKTARKEVIQHLNSQRTCMLSLPVGCGKTAIAIHITTTIKFKTLIIVNKLVLVDQWVDSIRKFCGDQAKVCSVKTNTVIDPEKYDIFVCNVLTVPKHTWDFIGFVVVDELHQVVCRSICNAMFHVHPVFLLGLSATPYRNDNLNELIYQFFSETTVSIHVERPHRVYVVHTNFTPVSQKLSNGKLDWNALINSQSLDMNRNKLIVDIVCKHLDRKHLLIVKRVDQGEMLSALLKEKGLEHARVFGKYTETTGQPAIIVASVNKAGTGFDAPHLNTLILCSDIESYFIQVLGRVMRSGSGNGTEPWVFDLIDRHPVLMRHYDTRVQTYKENGATFYKYITT